MPKVIDTDNIKWKIDSNNPEHVSQVDKTTGWEQPSTGVVRDKAPIWMPAKVPCFKESLQLCTFAAGIVGIGTFFATNRGRIAKVAALSTSLLVFSGTYGTCIYQYRKRLKFEYVSDLFPPGKEDEYIT